jgi:hypothetical protein
MLQQAVSVEFSKATDHDNQVDFSFSSLSFVSSRFGYIAPVSRPSAPGSLREMARGVLGMSRAGAMLAVAAGMVVYLCSRMVTTP